MPLRSMSPSTVERHLGERDPAGGGDVGQAGGQAGGQGVQHELDRGRAVVLADQHGRVVGVEGELALVRPLLADPEEVVDRAAAVGAGDPLVAGAELEPGSGRGLLHRVERGEQGRGVDAVAGRAWSVSWSWWCSFLVV